MADRPQLDRATRELLFQRGWMKPASIPSDPIPKVEDLLGKAINRGLEVTLTAVEGEAYVEKKVTRHKPDVTAVVTCVDGSWEGQHWHGGIALAKAIGLYLKATQPEQAKMVELTGKAAAGAGR